MQVERALLKTASAVALNNLSTLLSLNNFDSKFPFNLTKINGSIFDFEKSGEEGLINLLGLTEEHGFNYSQMINEVDDKSKMNHESSIKFAWELSGQNRVFASSINAIYQTTKLVVIGYSFPDFNTYVDEALFNTLRPKTDIYIQCNSEKNTNENSMIEIRIRELLPEGFQGKITLIPSSNRFFMPYMQDHFFKIPTS